MFSGFWERRAPLLAVMSPLLIFSFLFLFLFLFPPNWLFYPYRGTQRRFTTGEKKAGGKKESEAAGNQVVLLWSQRSDYLEVFSGMRDHSSVRSHIR